MRKKSSVIVILLAVAISQTACGSSLQTIFDSANDVVQTKEFEEAADRTGEALNDLATHIASDVLDTIRSAKKEGDENADSGAEEENKKETAETTTDPVEKTANAALTQVSYVRSKDGDTIIVLDDSEKEITVRLIGIDTPESVNPDENKNNEYGEIASKYTKELLGQFRTLYLQYDEGREDTYGRTLAYVWLRNDVDINDTNSVASYMFNAILVSQGYADTMTIAPNIKYAATFAALREDAKEKKAGLWQYEGYWLLEGEDGF